MQELKNQNVWVLYNGDKIPFVLKEGKANSGINYNKGEGVTKKTATDYWIKHSADFKGIGFIIAPPYVGVDLDHCIKNNGIAPYAKRILERLNSYAEISPSGDGVHIIVKSDKALDLTGLNIRFDDPEAKEYKEKGCFGFEMYTRGRYFTHTGDIYPGYDLPIAEIEAPELIALYENYKALKKGANKSEEGQQIVEGSRHNKIISRLYAYCMAHANATREEVENYLIELNNKCVPPLEQSDLERSIFSQIDKALKRAPVQRYENALKAFEGEFFGDPGQAVIDKLNSKLKKPTFSSVADNMSTFNAFIDRHRERIGTGFLNLDKKLNGGLFNELYVMAAETGQGKSAFTMQIAQNIAASGKDVLFFALEMSRNELIARGISCYSDKLKGVNPVTAADILYFRYDDLLEDFIKMDPSVYSEAQKAYFAECGEHLYIIQNDTGNDSRGLTAAAIRSIVADFAADKGHYPVVFVDYLQMIAAAKEDGSDRKNKIDNAVRVLKEISYNTPVFALSSKARDKDHRGEKVKIDSFKESGDIEYTGSVMLGLNFGVPKSCFVDPQKKFNEEAYNRAAAQPERLMEIELLKYRNSEKNSKADFMYHARYNNFIENE